jgi:hypothetical protein
VAAPRRRYSVARLVTAPIFFLTVTGVAAQSIVALASLAHNADVRDLAASIETGSAPDFNYLSRFVAENRLDRSSTDCGDTLTRARLTITLAALEAATKGSDLASIDAAKNNAIETSKHRLTCNPVDGNAWLRYAMVSVQASGPAPAAIDALQLSYWSAPSESWVMEARLPFATQLYLADAKGFETEYLDDLRRFVKYEPAGQVAATYVATAPRIRALLHPLIAVEPEQRKKWIVAEIDRLGMLFNAQ